VEEPEVWKKRDREWEWGETKEARWDNEGEV
jgi:hypothetical protein